MKTPTTKQSKASFKQFSKDCKTHFSKSALENTSLFQSDTVKITCKERSTRTARNVQKH